MQSYNNRLTFKLALICILLLIIVIQYRRLSNQTIKNQQLINELQTKQLNAMKIQEQIANNYNVLNEQLQKQTAITREIDTTLAISEVVEMGKPTRKLRKIVMSIVARKDRRQSNICAIFNAVTIIKQMTIASLKNFLEAGVGQVIVLLDSEEYLIGQHFASLGQYEVRQSSVTTDSEYHFIRNAVKECPKVVYLQNNFDVSEQNAAKLLRRSEQMEPLTLFFTTSVMKVDRGNTVVKALKDLNRTDLENGVRPEQISEYVFGFDSRFLDVVTPLNFAYFNRYTVEELLIYPILALLQGSQRLQKFEEAVHSQARNYVQFTEFELVQLQQDDQSCLCFLSFPNDPFAARASELREYLSALRNPSHKTNVHLIVFAPYRSNASEESLWETGKQLFVFQSISNVRLRIRANKTVVSLGAYESAHTYCPTHSVMVSSRQNIRFLPQFIDTLQNNITQEHHYYFYNFEDRGIANFWSRKPAYRFTWRTESKHFKNHFMHLQIYKNDLLRMLYLWALKCDQIDFYETEASITMPLLEFIKGKMKFPSKRSKKLFQVFNRSITEKQMAQLQNLKHYYIWPEMKTLLPISYNSLSNLSFRRFAKDRIPKKIHQIWLGTIRISSFRQALAETIRKNNPDYQYYLWREQNITKDSFPYTYNVVMRTLEFQEEADRFFISGVTDLLRSELIYRYGGIYLDYKTECRKSFDPFLKYEIFFADPDFDANYPKGMKYIGPGFEGGVKYSHYFNNLLTGILTLENINYYQTFFPKMIGGYNVRLALNDEQLYTVAGFGLQLVSQSIVGKRLCETQTQFTPDQQIFTIKSNKGKGKGKGKDNEILQIGLPCNVYKEAYIIYYMALGGSWGVVKEKYESTQT